MRYQVCYRAGKAPCTLPQAERGKHGGNDSGAVRCGLAEVSSVNVRRDEGRASTAQPSHDTLGSRPGPLLTPTGDAHSLTHTRRASRSIFRSFGQQFVSSKKNLLFGWVMNVNAPGCPGPVGRGCDRGSVLRESPPRGDHRCHAGMWATRVTGPHSLDRPLGSSMGFQIFVLQYFCFRIASN